MTAMPAELVSLQQRAEAMRVMLETYLDGGADPGDGVLASTVQSEIGDVQRVEIRWTSVYRDGGVAQVDPTSWLIGVAMVARTLIALRAQQTSIQSQSALSMASASGEFAVSASPRGFTVWMSAAYVVALDRYMVVGIVTWNERTEAN